MILTANHVQHDIQAIADQSAWEANRTAQEGPGWAYHEWRVLKAEMDAMDRQKRCRRLKWAAFAVCFAIGWKLGPLVWANL